MELEFYFLYQSIFSSGYLRDWGSIIRKVLREAGASGIDVHVIALRPHPQKETELVRQVED